jgi:biotin carboxylase
VEPVLVVYDFGSLAPTRLAQAAQSHGCELVFVAADTDHAQEMIPALELSGAVVNIAEYTEAECVFRLRELLPAGILTFSEHQIGTTARLAAALGLPYHRLADLPAITRKDRQRQRLAEAGIDNVRFQRIAAPDQVDEAIEVVGLPAILKPILGASSRNTCTLTTAEECHDAVAAMFDAAASGPVETELMLEELLVGRAESPPWGDYIAVDCIANADDVRPLFVTSKFALAEPYRERGGYGALSVVAEPEVRQVRDLACRAVGALGIHGIADVEIKLTPDGPRIIEVNGRLGAWVDDLAVRSHSVDIADVAVRAALGLEYEIPEIASSGPVAFHYLVVPPVGARRVRAVGDVAALRGLPAVDRVTVLSSPGAAVDWRIGSLSNVAAIQGTTETHHDLASTITAIEDTDWIEYEFC